MNKSDHRRFEQLHLRLQHLQFVTDQTVTVNRPFFLVFYRTANHSCLSLYSFTSSIKQCKGRQPFVQLYLSITDQIFTAFLNQLKLNLKLIKIRGQYNIFKFDVPSINLTFFEMSQHRFYCMFNQGSGGFISWEPLVQLKRMAHSPFLNFITFRRPKNFSLFYCQIVIKSFFLLQV